MTWTPNNGVNLENAVTLDALKGFWASTPPELRSLLTPLQNEEQYRAALHAFELLLPEVESPQATVQTLELFHLLGEHLQAYEGREVMPPVQGREILRFLMEQHHLKQSDLPEVGSQGVVSEILSGKRKLNVRQARALAARFHVAYTAFLSVNS